MTVLNLTAALADDVGVRLEQADELLVGRHRLVAEDPALALGDDARDQRQIMVDRDAPALGRRPGDRGRPCGGRLQLGPGGLGGGDQFAIELALFVLPAAVVDRARPLLSHTPAVAPPDRRRSGTAAAWRKSRVMTRTASHNSVLSLGSCISAALTVLSMRTTAPLSSLSALALASSA